jgi:hydroxymethylglutaryl-CoA reductase (NADPH)
MAGGLKNRGKAREDVEERRTAVEEIAGLSLRHIGMTSFDPIEAEKNIENMIGAVQVPLGFVGPLKVNGDHASGEFLVPLATTEGALVASVNRGCSAITASGGATAVVVKEEMTRAPVFRVGDTRHAVQAGDWVLANFERLKDAAEATTKHGKLIRADPFVVGRSFFVRMAFSTGDAMGMNMTTIASEAAAKVVEQETGAAMISVSGNFCVDKKPAAIDSILGRGKIVLADVTIPREVLESKLHSTPEAVAETCYRKCGIGSSLAVSLGSNAHAANMLSALYIATGQDPAQVVEGSMVTTTCEVVDQGLYVSVRLPCVEVGTVGGGTRLPCQREALSMIGCLGAGKARKLAEIVGAVVLAGELSTLAAQSAGHLGAAHRKLGR